MKCGTTLSFLLGVALVYLSGSSTPCRFSSSSSSFSSSSSLVEAAVLGVDLGSEFIKVAAVKANTPFHIVVDEQTKRKWPTVVAFDSNERFFSNNGIAFAAKRPKETYQWHSLWLGESASSPSLSFLKEEGWAYEISSNASRGGAIYVRHVEPAHEEVYLSAEELTAMNLQHVLKMAEVDAGGGAPIKDVVLTVPTFYTQRQRRALLDAADLAGMNVLSLINENTAAALQYGIDRKYDSSSVNSAHTVLFFNMGSTSTQVDLAVYSGYQVKPKKQDKDTVGQVEMRASAADPLLGGRSFEWAISSWLVKQVNADIKKKTGADVNVLSNPRAMAKIRAAAEKAKIVLSANIETPIFLSAVHNDMDFRYHLTRDQFVDMTSDLLKRVAAPIEAVLTEQKLKPSDIDAVLIIGGSVRIPSIQQAIKTAMQRDTLNQSLNGDEAMTFGALFRAANLSTTSRLRPFGLVDITNYPVGVRIADTPSDSPDSTASSSSDEPFSKRAALFKRYNQLEKRKLVSFSHTRDFTASLFYDDAAKYLPAGQSSSIGVYNISGVNELMKNDKYVELLKSQKPRIALSFELDSSGLATLSKAEATLEETVEVCTPKKISVNASQNDTNINSTTQLNQTDTSSSDSASPTNDAATDDTDSSSSSSSDSSDTDKQDASPNTDEQSSSASSLSSSSSSSSSNETTLDNSNSSKELEQVCETKKKNVAIKLKVRFAGGGADAVNPLTKSDRAFMRSRLLYYQQRDEQKRQIAAAQNSVESYIYSSRSLLGEEDMIAVSTEEQRDEAMKLLEAAEEWLYEKRVDDTADVYNNKLTELKASVEPIVFRRDEVSRRAEAVSTATSVFEHVRGLIVEFEEKRPWIKSEDRERLINMTAAVAAWLQEKQSDQEQLQPHEIPAFESRELLDKLKTVAKLASDLDKIKKPVEKPKPKSKSNNTNSNTTDADNNSTSTSTEDSPSEHQSPEQEVNNEHAQQGEPTDTPSEPRSSEKDEL